MERKKKGIENMAEEKLRKRTEAHQTFVPFQHSKFDLYSLSREADATKVGGLPVKKRLSCPGPAKLLYQLSPLRSSVSETTRPINSNIQKNNHPKPDTPLRIIIISQIHPQQKTPRESRKKESKKKTAELCEKTLVKIKGIVKMETPKKNYFTRKNTSEIKTESNSRVAQTQKMREKNQTISETETIKETRTARK